MKRKAMFTFIKFFINYKKRFPDFFSTTQILRRSLHIKPSEYNSTSGPKISVRLKKVWECGCELEQAPFK